MVGLPPIASTRYEWADLPLGVSLTGSAHAGREIGKSDVSRAIKVLKPGYWQRDLLDITLKRTADMPAHGGISRVLDTQLIREPCYLVGEWWGTVEGGRHRPRSLAVLRRNLRWREAPRLLLELGEILAHLHRHQLFHGSVKPTNILLTPEHRIKLTDYGLLPTRTVRSVPLATEPFFTPPEQWRDPTAWSDGRGQLWDVYSFGAVAFLLLTDRLPRLQNLAATLPRVGTQQHRGEPASDESVRVQERRIFTPERIAELLDQIPTICWPPRANVDPHWQSAITACLQIDPDARPRDMGEVCRMIASGHREQRRTTVRGFSNALVTLSAVAAVAVLGGWGGYMWYSSTQELSKLQKQIAVPLTDDASAQDQMARQEIAKQLLASRPTDLVALESLARTQLALDQDKEFAETMKLWTALVPNRSVGWYDITGDAARKRKDVRPALENYERAYAIAGNTPKGQELLEEIERLHISSGEYRSAADAVTRMLAAEDTTALRLRRARLYLLANSWREAFADMETVRKRDPHSAALRPLLPYMAQVPGGSGFGPLVPQLEAADRSVLQHPNDPGTHAQRAALLLLCGQMPAAFASAGRALELNPPRAAAPGIPASPADALPPLVQGLAHHAMLQHPELAAFAQPAGITSGPAFTPPSGPAPAKVLLAEKLPSAEALQKLAQMDADIRARPAADTLAKRASLLNDMEQHLLALSDTEAALALDKRYPAAQLEQVIALDQMDRAKEALPVIVGLTERSPKDSEVWEWRARTEKLLGRITVGLESVKKAMDLSGAEPAPSLVQLQQELKAMAPATTPSEQPVRDRDRDRDRSERRPAASNSTRRESSRTPQP